MTPREAQATVLANRYAMPICTVRRWMKDAGIDSYQSWVARYGPTTGRTHAESYEACYADVVSYVMGSDPL